MSSNEKPKNYLTPTEVAKMLMVSPVTIRQWAQRGDLPAQLTPGGHRRFLRHEIANFAKNRGLTLQHDSSDQLRIVIIDDDPQLVRFLTELLTDAAGHVEVQSASDGFEAGSRIQTFRPHVVLLDLMMPEVDGFKVCQSLKANVETKATRVIAMTGHACPENVERITAAGAEQCIEKPIDTDALLGTLALS